jgi:methionyl-tRNA formyltransferase
MSDALRFAFAGDRDIAVWVLEYLLGEGFRPQALLLRATKRASHAEQLAAMCTYLPDEHVLPGKTFRKEAGLDTLRALELDYIVGVHFPYIVPQEVLDIPRLGVLNLHPAFLPYNRGWHTPSWAILEGTPIGATLHYMDAGIDTGDIVVQQAIEVCPDDTADKLYGRVKRLELDVFRQAWPSLASRTAPRTPQRTDDGSSHVKEDLLDPKARRIDLDDELRAGDLIRKLRAHTTSDPAEAAFFEEDGKRYRVRVEIEVED